MSYRFGGLEFGVWVPFFVFSRSSLRLASFLVSSHCFSGSLSGLSCFMYLIDARDIEYISYTVEYICTCAVALLRAQGICHPATHPDPWTQTPNSNS